MYIMVFTSIFQLYFNLHFCETFFSNLFSLSFSVINTYTAIPYDVFKCISVVHIFFLYIPKK